MKKLNRILITSIAVIFFLVSFVSCDDALNNAPQEVKENQKTGDSVNVDSSLFTVDQTFKPADKKDGYVSDVALKLDVKGYDADYTYFNCFVTVTWSYTEITDANPTGVDREFSTTVELNANGDGSYSHKLSLQACRGISNIDVSYAWSGTATKL